MDQMEVDGEVEEDQAINDFPCSSATGVKSSLHEEFEICSRHVERIL